MSDHDPYAPPMAALGVDGGAAERLGKILGEHRRDKKFSIKFLLCGPFLLLIALFLLFVALADDSFGVLLLCGLLGLLFLALVLYGFVIWRREGRSVVRLREQGIEIQRPTEEHALAWSAIASARLESTKLYVNGIPAGRQVALYLTSDEGAKVVIRERTAEIDHVVDVVMKESFRWRFERIISTLESKGVIRFGPFSLTPTEIVKGHQSLSRSEADGAEVHQGWLQVYKWGAKRPWASARLGKVENGDVLISILEAERHQGLHPGR
jgi:hypothetical protein